MDKQTWTKIEKVLDRIFDNDPSTWPNLIDEMCGGDVELHNEIKKLIHRYPDIHSFLQTSPADSFAEVISEELADHEVTGDRIRTIGKYRIIDEIAHGGMGRVFLAERADGQYNQKVALKLLRASLDTESMRRRFRTERQILASLNHPNVARLLDGGVTKSGIDDEENLPYLVMEYVDGKPVIQYCDERKLSITDRLKLFKKIAETVQHAHRNLIVHCDIKPSNILVTEEGDVKLLDFGIARLMEEGSDVLVIETQTGFRRWMTPEYAAPEQIKGERPTIAVDVYQLGVLLYELLTGELPFKRDGNNIRELEQSILENEPVKPSMSVRTDRMRKTISGDLDHIVLKALRKEPDMRYASVEAIIDDLDRCLDNRPVLALQGNLKYRSRKFIRRHKGQFAAAVSITLLLIIYVITVTMYAGRVSRALDKAIIETSRAEQISDFLIDMFEASDPTVHLGEPLTVEELLEKGAGRIEELSDQPLIQASLMDIMGRAYRNLGHFEKARPILENSLELRLNYYDAEDPDVAQSHFRLGLLLHDLREYNSAVDHFEEAVRIYRELPGYVSLDYAQSLYNIGRVEEARRNYPDAERLYREALEIRMKLLGTEHWKVGLSLSAVGSCLLQMGEINAAEKKLRKAYRIYGVQDFENRSKMVDVLENLAYLLKQRGELVEAEQLYSQSLEMSRRMYGDRHYITGAKLKTLADVYRDRGEFDEAESMYREVLSIYIDTIGERHPQTAYLYQDIADFYRQTGDHGNAERLLREAVSIIGETLGPDHWRFAWARVRLGSFLLSINRYDEAEILLTESLEVFKELSTDNDFFQRYFFITQEELAKL